MLKKSTGSCQDEMRNEKRLRRSGLYNNATKKNKNKKWCDESGAALLTRYDPSDNRKYEGWWEENLRVVRNHHVCLPRINADHYSYCTLLAST